MDIIYEMNYKNTIEKRLQKLEEKCDSIETKLDTLIELLSENAKNCEKMSDHIDFVETVYENVKNPLGFICNKVNSMISGTHSLENKNLEIKN